MLYSGSCGRLSTNLKSIFFRAQVVLPPIVLVGGNLVLQPRVSCLLFVHTSRVGRRHRLLLRSVAPGPTRRAVSLCRSTGGGPLCFRALRALPPPRSSCRRAAAVLSSQQMYTEPSARGAKQLRSVKKFSYTTLEQLQARLTNPPREATYDELQKLVETRNKLKRLAFEDRISSLVSSFSKTCFRFLLWDFQFWMSQAGYVALRYYAKSTGCSAFPSLTPVSAVGSLSAFIIVFFTSQAWNRFMIIYNLAMSLEGRIFDLILLVQNTLPHAAVWRVWRHINAAHCLTYIGASKHYTEENLLTPLNNRYNFLTEEELHRVRSIGLSGGGATREVLSWVVTCIEEHMPAEHGNYRKQAVIDQVLRFRGAQGSIMDYVDMPFPFVCVAWRSSWDLWMTLVS